MTTDTALSLDLHGTRALVTGGTRGIGQAVAARLAQAGEDWLLTLNTNLMPAVPIPRARP